MKQKRKNGEGKRKTIQLFNKGVNGLRLDD